MRDTLTHRGPDEAGLFIEGPAGLGSRRLGTMDVAGGRQPMTNEDATVRLVFDGAVYNHGSLREELVKRGHVFATACDAEVVVHLYEEVGEQCVQRLRGMFAFALWDSRRRRLMLARDRLGIKPLFCYDDGRGLIFGSELKALAAHPALPGRVSPRALAGYLLYQYVPEPATILMGVRKLLPGHVVVADASSVRLQRYWRLEMREPKRMDEEEAAGRLLELLRGTVRTHMAADVPVGAFLSGGVDSSLVVALMAEAAGQPVRTFSMGFDVPESDQLSRARLVAQQFGTQHEELVIKPQMLEMLPRLASVCDEPFGDWSAAPAYLLCEMTRRHVTVALSGDGGDETFAGYDRYHQTARLEEALERLRRMRAHERRALALISEKHRRALPFLNSTPEDNYAGLLGHFFDEDLSAILLPDVLKQVDEREPKAPVRRLFEEVSDLPVMSRCQYVDLHLHLPNATLVKMDRASMAHSLEVRVPLLDHAVVEFAAQLPVALKLREPRLSWLRRGPPEPKYLLRKIAEKLLPEATAHRRKSASAIPFREWLGAGFETVARDMLLDRESLTRAYLRPERVSEYVDLSRDSETHAKRVWQLLILEHWLRGRKR
jgi:asparagine synthase (glutamine-hydrolysing)